MSECLDHKAGTKIAIFADHVADYEETDDCHTEVWSNIDNHSLAWRSDDSKSGFLLTGGGRVPELGELLILEHTGERPGKWVYDEDHTYDKGDWLWKVVNDGEV